jgi:hypothetical protein
MTTATPHTLAYVQPLFLETQCAREVYPRASFYVPIAALVLILVNGFANLITDRTSPVFAFLPGAIVITFFLGIGGLLMRYSTSTTVVETTMVQLRLALFGLRIWHRTIPIHQIRAVDFRDMGSLLSVLKHGVGELLFMTRGQCVRVHLPQFNYIYIGSVNPAELRDAIEEAIRVAQPGYSDSSS